MASFSQRLADALERKQLTQKQLAEQAGVTESAISYYLKGTRTPRGETLSRIAEVLGVSTDYLLVHTEDYQSDKLLYLQRNLNKLDEKQLKKAEDILKAVFDDLFDDED